MKARKAGRKRKEGVKRKPSGRIATPSDKQRQDGIMSVVLEQRKRKLPAAVLRKDPTALRDQKAESQFGILRLTGVIDADQYEAGIYWRDAFAAFARNVGIPSTSMPSTLAQGVKGIDHADLSPEQIAALRTRDAVIEGALMDHPQIYRDAKRAFVHVIVMDQMPGSAMLGSLREALNVIHRRCIMPERRRP